MKTGLSCIFIDRVVLQKARTAAVVVLAWALAQAWERLVNQGYLMRWNGTEQYEISVFTR
jgi:hypothetical protein